MKEGARKIEQDIADTLEGLEAAGEADKALDSIEKSGGIEEAKEKSKMGVEYAHKIQTAFESKADKMRLGAISNEFIAKGGDVTVLSEQLKGVYDSYIDLSETYKKLDDPAQEKRFKTMGEEIKAFQKDLMRSGEVTTPMGKDFLQRFNGGEFKDVEEANAALDKFATDAKGGDEGSKQAMEAEFSVLHELVADRFKGERGQKLEVEGGAIEDKEIDDVFGELGQ